MRKNSFKVGCNIRIGRCGGWICRFCRGRGGMVSQSDEIIVMILLTLVGEADGVFIIVGLFYFTRIHVFFTTE